jgi:hypothetical protein
MIVTQSLNHLGEALRRWTGAEERESPGWRSVGTMNHSYLWLDEAEAVAFKTELDALYEKHLAGRNAANHPPGTRRILTVFATVPEPAGD